MTISLLCLLLSATPNQGPAMKKLSAFLDEKLDAKPEAQAAIDERIKKAFEKPLAVMITDMSGFTELTKKRGILGFLVEIRRLQRMAEPVITKHGGLWIKADADDLFVVHTQAASMFALAKGLQEAVAASNKATGDTMGLGIGLGYGPTLQIGDEDIWGDSVNTSSKLGEDTAKATEILVSEAFYEQLKLEKKNAGMPTCEKIEAGARETKFPFYKCQ
jgi:adenylate cyclase